MNAKMKLFTVGPVEMDVETLRIGGCALPYFRTSEFSSVMTDVERNIKEFAGTSESSKVAVLTASGTAAMEAAVINVFTSADSLLIVNGGSFGERFVKICRIHRIPYEEIKLGFGECLTAEHFNVYDEQHFTGLLVNIHETSTGQLYPIDLISDFVKRNGLILMVDAISSLFADRYMMDEWGIDVTIFSSQKSLALPPGLSFVIANEKTAQKIKKTVVPSLYFRLIDYFNDMERGQTPYTPAVGIVLQLHAKLNKMADAGVNAVVTRTVELALDFRKRIAGTSFLLPQYPLSNAITPIICPKNNAVDIFLAAKNNHALMMTPSGGDLKDRLLRIGHLGNLTIEDNVCLEKYLRSI